MDKSTEHTNFLLQHQHNVRQRDKKKTKYEKYQAGITALRNLITSNIEESFVSEHNNSITEFHCVYHIVLVAYIRTNYGTVLLKQLQYNDIVLDAQWDPTTPIVVLFTHIEDWKLFAKTEEDSFTEKNILLCAYLIIQDTLLFNLSYDNWQDNPTSAKNWSNSRLLFTKESANIKHHTTGSFRLNDEAGNAILQMSDTFAAQQQEIVNMRAVQEQLSYDNWQDNPTSAKNWSNSRLLFTKESANIKHHTTGSFRLNDEAGNAILQMSDTFAAQQQ